MSNQFKYRSRGKSRQRRGFQRNRSEHDHESSSGSNDAESSCDIPGFYYDEEKKKYFKIMPNHSMVSGQISKDVIKSKEVETKRQKDLATFADKRPDIIQIKGCSSSTRHFNSCNIFHIIHNTNIGLLCPRSCRSLLFKHNMRSLCPRAVDEKVGDDTGHLMDKVEDAKFVLMSNDSRTIVGVWSLSNVLSQLLTHLHVKPARKTRDDSQMDLALERPHRVVAMGHDSVTSLCWAPRSPEEVNTTRVFVTATSFLGDESNVAKVWDYASFEDNIMFDLGRHALWSGAWNCHANSFSVGTESNSLVVEVNTRKMWEFNSHNSSVYAQIFSQSGRQLFAGNKRGEVLVHDLHSSSSYASSVMKHNISVAHLYHALDENTLIVSDVSGKIKKWDLRQCRAFQEFKGHINNYVKLPFHVDSQERIIYAVGEDCYTRIWCYKTGELLKTIPSPFPVSVDRIPVVAYSDSVGGAGGLPGLLMAVRGELHLYSL